MATPVAAHKFNLGHALEFDLGIVVLGLSAMLVSFLTGDAPRWHNLVLAPIAFGLALGCEMLVYRELREMWRADPDTPHRNGAAAAAAVAGVFGFFTIPIVVIMPIVFLAGIFHG